MNDTPIPVGLRLPLTTSLTPRDLVAIAEEGVELGFSSLFAGDHVLLPGSIESPYPHTANAVPPFSIESHWLDALLKIGWVAGQISAPLEIGTSVMLLPLRNPVLFAKQVSSLSWLTQRGVLLGIGSGWLRDEYDVVGADFEHRATVAIHSIKTMRSLLESDLVELEVGPPDARVRREFAMRPRPAGKIELLWGGHSPLALRIIARHCDGWLPTKRSFEQLEECIDVLKRECDAAERSFDALRLVVKPGPGPFPSVGRIDGASLERYAALGFRQAVLELPLEPTGVQECIDAMRTIAAAC